MGNDYPTVHVVSPPNIYNLSNMRPNHSPGRVFGLFGKKSRPTSDLTCSGRVKPVLFVYFSGQIMSG